MAGIKVGDTITFGRYPQSGADAGPEPIEWIVLDIFRKDVTLISRRALDALPYNEEDSAVTWESCTLRHWLNHEFAEAAFSDDERAMLVSATVMAGVNPAFPTDPGPDTRDRVYLLSIEEAERLFRSDRARICAATAWAKARGAKTNREETCLWWLRSPGRVPDRAAFIIRHGSILRMGCIAINDDLGVRPAITLDLTSL